MKKIINKNIFSLLTLLTISLFFVSCEEEDNTGHSVLVPTSTSVTITTEVSNHSLIEDDSVYEITATLSQAQAADVVLYIHQVAGDATMGEDFEVDGSITVPAGATSATGSIKILADEVIEGTETLTIQIGDDTTANAGSVTPGVMEFTIMNYTVGDLAIDLNWHPDAFDQTGEQIDPTDIADMIFYLIDPNGDVLAVVDGGSYESYVLSSDEMDGLYTIKTGFYAAMQFDNPVELNLGLDYNQVGVFNDSHSFTGLLSTASADLCETVIYLANIEKMGTTYSVIQNEYLEFTPVVDNYVGNASGTTSYGYETQVVTTLDGNGQLWITGIGVGFMENDWGEVIVDMQALPLVVEPNGDFVIEEAYYMETTYGGDPQPAYHLSAVGNLRDCQVMYIDYDFVQGGTSYTDWLTVGNGWPAFEELISF